MNASFLTELLILLGTVVSLRREGGSFDVLGTPPDWFKALFPDLVNNTFTLTAEDELSFLGSFVVDASKFWELRRVGLILWSGPWEESLKGKTTELEAGALCLDGKDILLVRLLGHDALADREVIQKAREQVLSYEELSRAERDLKKYTDYLEEKVQQRTLEVTKTLAGVIQSIIAITEMRDPYTAGHQRRVSQLACAIAREMGRPAGEIDGLRMACILHDIGKIYVPAEILSKPSCLSSMEAGIIRVHPQTGYDILKNIDFPRPIAQIVLQHHENIDGSGYPRGLSGDEILLKARILRVADVVEAMVSYRPYRPLLGLTEALDEIRRNRGVLYDVSAVDACLRLFEENRFQFE